MNEFVASYQKAIIGRMQAAQAKAMADMKVEFMELELRIRLGNFDDKDLGVSFATEDLERK